MSYIRQAAQRGESMVIVGDGDMENALRELRASSTLLAAYDFLTFNEDYPRKSCRYDFFHELSRCRADNAKRIASNMTKTIVNHTAINYEFDYNIGYITEKIIELRLMAAYYDANNDDANVQKKVAAALSGSYSAAQLSKNEGTPWYETIYTAMLLRKNCGKIAATTAMRFADVWFFKRIESLSATCGIDQDIAIRAERLLAEPGIIFLRCSETCESDLFAVILYLISETLFRTSLMAARRPNLAANVVVTKYSHALGYVADLDANIARNREYNLTLPMDKSRGFLVQRQ